MASESTTTLSPPSNPFSSDGGDEGVKFDAFSLSPSSGGGGASSSSMPSLQSIQQQEQQQMQQQQQNQQQPLPPQQEMKFDSLPSPEELSGPMNDTSKPLTTTTSNNWPPPSSSTTNNTYGLQPNNTNLNNNQNNNNNQPFLTKLLTCGGICSIETLRPYFDIDTADIFVRMKGSIQYALVMNGFRNEVLYSDNAFRLAYRDTTTSGGGEDGDGEGGDGEGGGSSSSRFTPPALQSPTSPSTSSSGKGPDLYGPVWITLTLVFFVAVTSNISLYIHHTTLSNKHKSTIVDEGGIAAEEEWDYDINQLLHATWILYSFSMGLPTLLYFMLRLIGGSGSSSGGNSNLGLVELICLYGYSLVPYLPMTWLCIVPYGWVQWLVLSVATVLSGMLVLRNVAGSILDTSGGGGGVGGGFGGLHGKKGGSLLMCIVGFHLIFLLVMKLAFYHHS